MINRSLRRIPALIRRSPASARIQGRCALPSSRGKRRIVHSEYSVCQRTSATGGGRAQRGAIVQYVYRSTLLNGNPGRGGYPGRRQFRLVISEETASCGQRLFLRSEPRPEEAVSALGLTGHFLPHADRIDRQQQGGKLRLRWISAPGAQQADLFAVELIERSTRSWIANARLRAASRGIASSSSITDLESSYSSRMVSSRCIVLPSQRRVEAHQVRACHHEARFGVVQ